MPLNESDPPGTCTGMRKGSSLNLKKHRFPCPDASEATAHALHCISRLRLVFIPILNLLNVDSAGAL